MKSAIRLQAIVYNGVDDTHTSNTCVEIVKLWGRLEPHHDWVVSWRSSHDIHQHSAKPHHHHHQPRHAHHDKLATDPDQLVMVSTNLWLAGWPVTTGARPSWRPFSDGQQDKTDILVQRPTSDLFATIYLIFTAYFSPGQWEYGHKHSRVISVKAEDGPCCCSLGPSSAPSVESTSPFSCHAKGSGVGNLIPIFSHPQVIQDGS